MVRLKKRAGQLLTAGVCALMAVINTVEFVSSGHVISLVVAVFTAVCGVACWFIFQKTYANRREIAELTARAEELHQVLLLRYKQRENEENLRRKAHLS